MFRLLWKFKKTQQRQNTRWCSFRKSFQRLQNVSQSLGIDRNKNWEFCYKIYSRLMEARQLSLKSGRNREEIPKMRRFPSDNSFQRLDEYVLAVERAQLGHDPHGMLRIWFQRIIIINKFITYRALVSKNSSFSTWLIDGTHKLSNGRTFGGSASEMVKRKEYMQKWPIR